MMKIVLLVNVFFICICCAEKPLENITKKLEKDGVFFGSAILWSKISTDSVYREHVKNMSMATPETEMKFSNIENVRDVFNWSACDSLVSFCNKNKILVRGHTLMWHAALPEWICDTINMTKDSIKNLYKDYINIVVKHFKNKLYCWDVVNEATMGINGIPYKTIGKYYPDSAFVWASNIDNKTKLFYNDSFRGCNDVWSKRRMDSLFVMVKRFVSNGIKIDGLGFQFHNGTDDGIDYTYMKMCVDSFANMGLEIHFTEVDVYVDTPFTCVKYKRQAEIYGETMKMFLSCKSCTSFIVWGFTDKYSWIPAYSNGSKGDACLLDVNYKVKDAFNMLNLSCDCKGVFR